MDYKGRGLDTLIDSISSPSTLVGNVEIDIQNSANTVQTTYIAGYMNSSSSSFQPRMNFRSGTVTIPTEYAAMTDGSTGYSSFSNSGSAMYISRSTCVNTYGMQFTGWIHRGEDNPPASNGQTTRAMLTTMTLRVLYYSGSLHRHTITTATSATGGSYLGDIIDKLFIYNSYGQFYGDFRSYAVAIK